jgi:hypothetical protein
MTKAALEIRCARHPAGVRALMRQRKTLPVLRAGESRGYKLEIEAIEDP